jgi:WD40 repeat protein
VKTNSRRSFLPPWQKKFVFALFLLCTAGLTLPAPFIPSAKTSPRPTRNDKLPASFFRQEKSAFTTQVNSPVHLCILAPTVKQGSLSGEAFVDRLIGQLKTKQDAVQAAVLENVTDQAALKQEAAKAGCQLTLSLIIAGDSPTFRLPFGKKYKLEVQYRIEDLSNNQSAAEETLSEKGNNPENVLRTVQSKIIEAILVKASPIIGTAKPSAPPGDDVNARTAPRSPTSNLFRQMDSRPRLVVQTSHTSMVTDFVYSPNGKLLATLAADGVLKLWLTSKGHEIVSIPGYQIVGMAFHPDSRSIAGLSKNGVLRIFDVSTAAVLHRLTPIKSGGGSLIPLPVPKIGKKEESNPFFNLPSPVAFSSTGKVLVSGGNGGVKVWDIDKSTVLYQMANKEYVDLVALSSDGSLVAGVVEKYRIKIWSTATGKESRVINTDIAQLSAVSFSADGNQIACGNINGTLKAYNVNDGKEIKKLIDGPGEEAFIAAGRKVGRVPVVGDVGDAVSDLIEGADQLRNLLFKNKSIRAVAFNPDGKSLAYQAGDNVIHVLRIDDNKEILTVEQDDPFDTDGGNKNKGSAKGTGVTTKKPSEAISAYFRQLCPIRYSTDGKTLNGCKNFKSIQRWDAVTGQELMTLAVAKRGAIKGQKVPIPFPLTTVPRFANDKLLLTSSFAGGVKLWDLEKRSNPQRIVDTSPALGNNLPVSPNGELLMRVSPDEKTVAVYGLNSEKEIRSFAVEDPPNQKIIAAQFSPDSKMITLEILEEKVRLKFFASRKVQLRVMDITSGQKLFEAGNILENQFAFSPDTTKFAYMPKGQSLWDSFRNKTEIDVYEVGTAPWRELYEKDVEREFDSNYVSKVVFSSDSKLLASEDKDMIKVWDASNGKQMYEHKLDLGTNISSFVFVPGKNNLTFTIFSRIYSWNLDSKRVEKLRIETDLWGTLSYSPNGKTIALGGVENKVRLFSVDTQDELGSLIAPNEEDWMLTTPDGRFDTSRLDEIEEVHWIMPNEPFNPEAVEVFMRYFYEPRLLTRLLNADDFDVIPDLAKINRSQPKVKIKEVVPLSADSVRVSVDVADGPSETQTNAQGQPMRSGVYDVRLFRNGQLVGYSTSANKLAELSQQRDSQQPAQEVAAWRQANRVSVDPSTGHALLTFENVKVPQRGEKSRVVFSAYAFNEDRVKSLTDRYYYDLPAAAQPRKGRAYIISVGVSAFENPSFNLEFADNDAKAMQAVIEQDLKATGQFSEVVPITLTSNYQKQGEQIIVTEKLATKANLQRVLMRLSSRNQAETETLAKTAAAAPSPTPSAVKLTPRGRKGPPSKNAPSSSAKPVEAAALRPAGGAPIPNLEKLQPATPDDLVLVLFSSHGYADRAGNFYLIPYDTGAGTEKVFTETVRQHSVSTDDLSSWLRDVDAGELVMIVDACHSTAAVEGRGFKPGPMGSRGLGQLSYDKGMRILTATQADNVALENKSIAQGLLTYSLTRDGLESQHADFKPRDKTITLLEWLEYGEDRVPKLNDEIIGGQISASGTAGDRPRMILIGNARGLEDTGPAPANASQSVGGNGGAANNIRLQQPALFDFARQGGNTVLVRNP